MSDRSDRSPARSGDGEGRQDLGVKLDRRNSDGEPMEA
jgi:hypothetical protein